MGADLILAHLDVTELWEDPDRARTELHRRIDATEAPPDWFDDPRSPAEVLAAWHDHLRNRIEFIFEAGARDVVVIEVAGRTVLVTGGTSWGDSPSEALDALTDLDEAGILAEPWPWVGVSDPDPWLVVEGSPIGGFSFYGPYPNSDAAVVAHVGRRTEAELKLSHGEPWWIVQTEGVL